MLLRHSVASGATTGDQPDFVRPRDDSSVASDEMDGDVVVFGTQPVAANVHGWSWAAWLPRLRLTRRLHVRGARLVGESRVLRPVLTDRQVLPATLAASLDQGVEHRDEQQRQDC